MNLIMKINKLRLKGLVKKISKLKAAFDEAEKDIIKDMEIIEKKSKIKEDALTKTINDLMLEKANLLDERDASLDTLSKDRNNIIKLRKNMFEN